MMLVFEQVFEHETSRILEIYKILKDSGDDMYQRLGLEHWKTPYPIESIRFDCAEKKVFLAKDTESNLYVGTFQLQLMESFGNAGKSFNLAEISKFATSPNFYRRGIGKQSLEYIEAYCRRKNVSRIHLNVYDKSDHAVLFYKNMGFRIVGTEQTKHFHVFLMEKFL